MHYMYFNGGFVYADCPRQFHRAWLENALRTRDYLKDLKNPVLPTYPWLDQIALGVTCSQFGGMHDGVSKKDIDGKYAYHYHYLPTLYLPKTKAALKVAKDAKADPEIGPLLKEWDAFQSFISDEGEDLIRGIMESEGIKDRKQLIAVLKARKLSQK